MGCIDPPIIFTRCSFRLALLPLYVEPFSEKLLNCYLEFKYWFDNWIASKQSDFFHCGIRFLLDIRANTVVSNEKIFE